MLRAGFLAAVILLAIATPARAEPTVSVGAGGTLIVGAYLGLTADVHASWWLRPSWAIAVNGGVGGMTHGDPAGSGVGETFVADVGVGPVYRHCGRRACRGLSSQIAFERHRAHYEDGLVQDVGWSTRGDSLFVELRALGQLLVDRGGHVTIDASLGLRGHRMVSYHSDAERSDGPPEDYWPNAVASLGLSAHF